MATKSIMRELKSVNNYIDLGFLLKFIGFFLVFYYANLFFVQLTLPGGKWYNEFFSNNLNYIEWLTASLTHMSGYIGELFGVDNYVRGHSVVATSSGRGVNVKWECIGLGIYSFWLAFILAHKMSAKRKIILSVVGIVLMWLLNCIRIALLLYAVDNNLKEWKKSWKFIGDINHHDLYNYACYIIIIGMIYLYYRKTSKKTKAATVKAEQ